MLTKLFDFVCASPRSGRQSKAWGAAEGVTPGLIGTHSSHEVGDRQYLSPVSRARLQSQSTWGCAFGSTPGYILTPASRAQEMQENLVTVWLFSEFLRKYAIDIF